MYRRKKCIIILAVVLILTITFFIVISNMFIKKISIDELKGISLNTDENVYICRIANYTGPEWVIVGDKNGLYGKNKQEEQVIMEGDFLPFLFRDRIDDSYSRTNFVIIAKVKTSKVYTKSDPTLYRVLKVNKWYILTK